MKLVSVEEMRAIEQEANARGVTYEQMMQTAGEGVAQVILSMYAGEEEQPTALALVGSGNNGGDALVALQALMAEGWRGLAYLVRPRPAKDPLMQQVKDAGAELLSMEEDADFRLLDAWLYEADVLMDGVLGTGVRLPLKEEVAGVLGHISGFSPLPFVVAVDCPSGVDADTGDMAEETIPADVTVTMEAVKRGLLEFPAFTHSGYIEVVSLGLPVDLEALQASKRMVITDDYVAGLLPERPLDAHKGTFGTAMIVGGSVNFTGAVYLAGKAAYLVGAGLVRIGVPAPLYAALAGRLPEATWLVLPHEMGVINEKAWDVLKKNLEKISVLLLGPGFGLEDTTGQFVHSLLTSRPGKPVGRGPLGFVKSTESAGSQEEEARTLPPLVLDADGLKLLKKVDDWHTRLPAGTILTPHPGEMSVLTGLGVQEIQSDRVGKAEEYAREWGHVLVLKGAVTVIAAPDGRTALVPIATPGLARAGTGDVLAGAIAGLRAQGLDAFDAAAAGAWIHAQAGVEAVLNVGHSASVLASDVLEAIPGVLTDLEG